MASSIFQEVTINHLKHAREREDDQIGRRDPRRIRRKMLREEERKDIEDRKAIFVSLSQYIDLQELKP